MEEQDFRPVVLQTMVLGDANWQLIQKQSNVGFVFRNVKLTSNI